MWCYNNYSCYFIFTWIYFHIMRELYLVSIYQMGITASVYKVDITQQTFVLMKTSCRSLVFKMSWSRRISSPQPYVFRRRLQDVSKTSWSKPIYSSWPYVFKTSSKRLQDLFKASSRRLQDVLKTSSRCLQDIFKTSCKDIFKTFSRRTIKLICST